MAPNFEIFLFSTFRSTKIVNMRSDRVFKFENLKFQSSGSTVLLLLAGAFQRAIGEAKYCQKQRKLYHFYHFTVD